jgi:hypothetical protein
MRAYSFVVLVAFAGCGGSIAGTDYFGGDASVDAAPSGTDGGVDAPTNPQCPANPVLGEACAVEGIVCGPPCNDPCKFCNGVRCQGGKWQRIEVPPDPSCKDAGTPTTDARMSWQGPGGFSGLGPALVLGGDGSVRVWRTTSVFDPDGAPTIPPSSTYKVTPALAADLFKRWSSTNLAVLPHPGGGADCYAVVHVRTCAACQPTTLKYQQAKQLAPEMSEVWSWFAKNLPQSDTAGQPEKYCSF